MLSRSIGFHSGRHCRGRASSRVLFFSRLQSDFPTRAAGVHRLPHPCQRHGVCQSVVCHMQPWRRLAAALTNPVGGLRVVLVMAIAWRVALHALADQKIRVAIRMMKLVEVVCMSTPMPDMDVNSGVPRHWSRTTK